LLLAMLDDLDSKVEAMQRLMTDPLASGDWTRISPMFERPIYRRRTIELANGSTPPAASQPEAPPREGQTGSFNTPFARLAGLGSPE